MADAPEKQFKPFVPDDAIVPEFTLKAIVLGAFFGILFGAATVYLALRAGLTVSASIPIAVLAIAVFKRFGKSTILENNIVQTIGSAGESVAAGVVFTLPAFLFLAGGEAFFNYTNIFILALVGGIIGVLFMVPLRRSLIVKEHGKLLYPEGTACAEVLIAGEKGGEMAGRLFRGLGIAVGYKVLMSVLGLWKADPTYTTSRTAALPNAQINAEITPEYLGVGYIIGPKIAGQLVGGGVLAQLVLVPLIYFFGAGLVGALAPAADGSMIANMSPGEIRLNYVRYIGAGAVAAAGFITLLRTLPTIASAFKEGFAGLKKGAGAVAPRRTERDLPMSFVLLGSLALILIISILPQVPGSFPGSLLMGLLVMVFGFFFVTVSSRIVGIIGSSSNPISGMTIATLMATCVIFVALGWTGDVYQAMALSVGGIVCIAAANAGATSQDLKTGYIVGGTPRSQQIGLIIGVVASVFVIGWTMNLLDQSMRFEGIAHAIGTDKFPAPQGTLMATIIKGLLAQDLPWALVFAGAAISVVMELCGVHSLSFAVGAYLPLSTTAPIWAGGLMRALVDRKSGQKEESEVSSGMLYSTGLVAGGSLAGVLIAGLSVVGVTGPDGQEMSLIQRILDLVGVHGWERLGPGADLIGLVAFIGLCILLVRAARQKMAA
ncbi:MAG: oligopeptide transporter, OPT family [Thermoanaerobaculia bacterium]|nr:MAG: oligopeptide transporter, OPT family [Thermoanaerobaculia bacterium]MBZ0101191.1 oligopeptide transporter, OPT family [Thermoanaerobaculia bacterium]